MNSATKNLSVHEYIDTIADGRRREAIARIRQAIVENLPPGFAEVASQGMLNYVVPHETYPAGYHCNPAQPLPFISLASQKNNISLYHMGLYADDALLDWFRAEWTKHSKKKLDMGKSCIRFKKEEDVPVELIGNLVSRMSPARWIATYEKVVKR